MPIQAETIVAGLIAAWQADPTLTTLVPGGIWYGQAPQDDTPVRATMVFQPTGEALKAATRDYIQMFTVTVSLYASKTMTSSSWPDIRNAMNTVWCGVVSPVVTGATLVSFEPANASVNLAPARRNGEDVLIGIATFSGMAQGTF